MNSFKVVCVNVGVVPRGVMYCGPPPVRTWGLRLRFYLHDIVGWVLGIRVLSRPGAVSHLARVFLKDRCTPSPSEVRLYLFRACEVC